MVLMKSEDRLRLNINTRTKRRESVKSHPRCPTRCQGAAGSRWSIPVYPICFDEKRTCLVTTDMETILRGSVSGRGWAGESESGDRKQLTTTQPRPVQTGTSADHQLSRSLSLSLSSPSLLSPVMDLPFCDIADAPNVVAAVDGALPYDPSSVKHLWAALAALAIAVPIHAWRTQVKRRRPSLSLLARAQSRHPLASSGQLARIQEEQSDDDLSSSGTSNQSPRRPSQSQVIVGPSSEAQDTLPHDYTQQTVGDTQSEVDLDVETSAKQKRSRTRYKRGPNPLKDRSSRAKQRVASWTSVTSHPSEKSDKHAVTSLEMALPMIPNTTFMDETPKQNGVEAARKKGPKKRAASCSTSSVAETENSDLVGLFPELIPGGEEDGEDRSYVDYEQDRLSDSSSIPSSTLETPASSCCNPQISLPLVRLSNAGSDGELDIYPMMLPLSSSPLPKDELFESASSTAGIDHEATLNSINSLTSPRTGQSYVPPPRHRRLIGHSPSSSPSRGSPPSSVLYDTSPSQVSPNESTSHISLRTQIASLKGALSASAARETTLQNHAQRLQTEIDDMRMKWAQDREAWSRRELENGAYVAQLTYQLTALHQQQQHVAYQSMWNPWFMTVPGCNDVSSVLSQLPKLDGGGNLEVNDEDQELEQLSNSPVGEAILKRPLSSWAPAPRAVPTSEVLESSTSELVPSTRVDRSASADPSRSGTTHSHLPPKAEELIFPSLMT